MIEINGVKIGPAEILGSFADAVGPHGTLLLPLFNFDFASGSSFDIQNTASQMGALSEFVRKQPTTVSTGHPIYSFGVLDSKAEAFRVVDNKSAYADDTPFGILK
jgi:aminoglycoside 3-N-acetyltransferase